MLDITKVREGMYIEYIGDSFAYGGSYQRSQPIQTPKTARKVKREGS